jgi:hypothetical protein
MYTNPKESEMSFSFNFTANDKLQAKEQVSQLMAETLNYQPHHRKDVEIATETACKYIDLMEEKPDWMIAVEVYGSISYPYDAKPEEDFPVTAVQLGVRVWQTPRVDTSERAEG